MKWSKWWLFLFVVGIVMVTTVYYVTVVGREKVSYANGRLVRQELQMDEDPFPVNVYKEKLAGGDPGL